MVRRARLGELERMVMDHLWAFGEPATVRDVHDALAESRNVAYTTVMTVLDRLARKGSVTQIRDGRAYRYVPAVSRDELTAELMHDALDTVDGSDRTAALLRFVDSVTPDDADALRAALAEVERRAWQPANAAGSTDPTPARHPGSTSDPAGLSPSSDTTSSP